MKKTTAFFLTIGIITMIGGGIGAATFYQRAERTMVTHKKEEHKIKNKNALEEVHLKLTGNANYVLQTEASDKVLMETSFGPTFNINSSLKVEEKDNRLNISTTGNQSDISINKFKIGIFFEDFSPEVVITIPNNTKKIVIDGDGNSRVHLVDITTNDLEVKLTHSDLIFSTTNVETLTAKLTTGGISLSGDTRSKEISVSTNSGDLNLNDLSIEKLTASSGTGNIYLDQINGVSTVETNQGDIRVTNLKGEASFKLGNGSFALRGYDVLPKKLSVTSNSGDISIYPEEILYNTSIKATSKLGDVEIFGKERTSYTNGKNNRTFDLSTQTGDISVSGPSDYKDED